MSRSYLRWYSLSMIGWLAIMAIGIVALAPHTQYSVAMPGVDYPELNRSFLSRTVHDPSRKTVSNWHKSSAPSKPQSVGPQFFGIQQERGAHLSVVAEFETQPGVANRLAGFNYVLLKESLDDAMKRIGFRPPSGMSTLRGWALGCENGQPICQQALNAALSGSGVAAVKADADGRAQFSGLRVESYYLFALTRYNNHFVLWNLKLELKPGANSITLKRDNATMLD